MSAPRPTGSDHEAFFHVETWDETRGPKNKLRNTSTVSVRRTPWGTFLNGKAQGSGGISTVKLYKITSLHQADYFGAKLWNVTTNDVSGSEIMVAKCIGGRMVASEMIDGLVVSYVYGDAGGLNKDNIRKGSSPGYPDEWQVCHTRYDASDPVEGIAQIPGLVIVSRCINGSGVKDGNGNQIYFIEESPQRFWAYQQDQSGSL